jgi:hypothetical protein
MYDAPLYLGQYIFPNPDVASSLRRCHHPQHIKICHLSLTVCCPHMSCDPVYVCNVHVNKSQTTVKCHVLKCHFSLISSSHSPMQHAIEALTNEHNIWGKVLFQTNNQHRRAGYYKALRQVRGSSPSHTPL